MSVQLVVEETAALRIEVALNGRAKAAIRLLAREPRSTLLQDTADVTTASERARLLEQVPEELRGEASILIEQAANSVFQARAAQPDAKPLSASQGTVIAFADDEPATELVDGAVLLTALGRTVKKYIVAPPGAATAIALWLIHCFAHDASQVSPILAITAPEKRCGKSRLLTLLSKLVPRPLPTANITAAAVFRTVERFYPTLLIDESDTFFKDDEALRGILNSGHYRGAAFVVRLTGDEHEPRTFSTWCPKAIAAIGALTDTLADRSITVRLQRRARGEQIAALRLDRADDEFKPFRRQAARWTSDHHTALLDADPEMPPELDDRAADNWRPLLAIADLAGGRWPKYARTAALTLSGHEVLESAPTQLLADLRLLFTERKATRLTSIEVVQWLGRQEDRPWPEWSHGKEITARGVARLLKRFDIGPKAMRDGGEVFKGYSLEDFNEAFSRYLPSLSVTPVTPLPDNDLPTPPIGNTQEACNRSQGDASHCEITHVTDVTDEMALELDYEGVERAGIQEGL